MRSICFYEASGHALHPRDGSRERQSGVPSAEHEHRLSGDDFGDPQTNCVAEIRAVIRQSRGQWLTSLVAFCAMISALFLAAMLLATLLLSAPMPRRARDDGATSSGWLPTRLCGRGAVRAGVHPVGAVAAGGLRLGGGGADGVLPAADADVLAFALLDCGNVGIIVCVMMVTAHITLLAELFPGSSRRAVCDAERHCRSGIWRRNRRSFARSSATAWRSRR